MACTSDEDEPELRTLPSDDNLHLFGPSYADLPMELLEKIFFYLTPYDRREAGLSCRRWFEASLHKTFLDQSWLVLESINGNQPPVHMFLESVRHFPNIYLRETDIKQLGNFFQHFGPHIRRIVFDSCAVHEPALFDILSHLSGLRSLTMQSCWPQPQSGRVWLFEDRKKLAELRQTLSGVTELTLAHIQHPSDVAFEWLMVIMPSLCSLRLLGCNVSLVPYYEFYNGNQWLPNPHLLSLHFISQEITKREVSLRELDCNLTGIDDRGMSELVAIGHDLQLERLILGNSKELSLESLTMLRQAQFAHLQHLDISRSCCTDSCLIQICQEFPGLRVLKLKSCAAISNRGVQQVAHLPKLEVLDISFCKFTDEGILGGIASKRNETIRELYISDLSVSERSIIAITEKMPELRLLELGHYGNYDHNNKPELCLQLIFRNLVHLRHLKLNSLKHSDRGLTGLGMLEEMQRHMQATRASTDVPPGPASCISVGNEHQSALREAASSTGAFSGYSINRLHWLQVLNLDCCEKLTDDSFFNFRLLELRELSLVRCNRITHEGIQALVRGCPAIEKLNLTKCCNITDESVHQILLHLRRLRDLNLSGCHNVTNSSLDYIACHGHRLRILHLRGCYQIDVKTKGRFPSMRYR